MKRVALGNSFTIRYTLRRRYKCGGDWITEPLNFKDLKNVSAFLQHRYRPCITVKAATETTNSNVLDLFFTGGSLTETGDYRIILSFGMEGGVQKRRDPLAVKIVPHSVQDDCTCGCTGTDCEPDCICLKISDVVEQGYNGLTPMPGENGNWWIGTEDTGKAYAPHIGENGHWWIGDLDTGRDFAPTPGENGNWWVDGKDTGRAWQGKDGQGVVYEWKGTTLRLGTIPVGGGETAWGDFVDLKGDKGDKGNKGKDGIDGDKGEKGDPGGLTRGYQLVFFQRTGMLESVPAGGSDIVIPIDSASRPSLAMTVTFAHNDRTGLDSPYLYLKAVGKPVKLKYSHCTTVGELSFIDEKEADEYVSLEADETSRLEIGQMDVDMLGVAGGMRAFETRTYIDLLSKNEKMFTSYLVDLVFSIFSAKAGDKTRCYVRAHVFRLEEAKPTILVDMETVDFGKLRSGKESASKDIAVTTKNLIEDMTISLTGESIFSVSPSDTLAKDGTKITVTCDPDIAPGSYKAILTLASSDAVQEINLIVEVVPVPEIIVDPASADLGEIYRDNSANMDITVTTKWLTEDITLSYEGSKDIRITTGYDAVNEALIIMGPVSKDGGKINVFIHNIYTIANFTGTLTLASSGVTKTVEIKARGTLEPTIPTTMIVNTRTLDFGTFTSGSEPSAKDVIVTLKNGRGAVTQKLGTGGDEVFTVTPAELGKEGGTFKVSCKPNLPAGSYRSALLINTVADDGNHQAGVALIAVVTAK